MLVLHKVYTFNIYKKYHQNLYQIQETDCNYESRLFYISLKICEDLNRGSSTIYTSYFIFVWYYATCNSFLKISKFRTFY